METKEIRTMRVRRYSLISARPFDQVVTMFERGLSRPDLGAFTRSMESARTAGDLLKVVQNTLGSSSFIEFVRFDMGAVLSKEGRTVKSLRFLIGDPLIMREMASHVPDAASYAPVTVLIEEREDGTHLSYDLMADYLLPYENAAASRVARELDEKVERLMDNAA
ncbi:MAG TPA: DUF302 domain-containing protein [Elusimicrobiota bacterium]|nr:DUF302 domain-containing protein [Elusimicrobiota bacterium]